MADSNPRPDDVRLDLFGGFRLTCGGRLVSVSSRRARALIAYLWLARDRAAPRGRLAGLLWSDRAEEQARASLRQCLLETRTALAACGMELIDAGRETVRLRGEALSSDVADLELALADRDGDALKMMLATLGDRELLVDAGLGGLFGEWLEATRAQLDQRITDGVHARLDELEAAQAWNAVRQLAEAFLLRDALDETVVAAAMRANAALGHTSAAYRRFQILQAALQREYGVSPGAEPRDALAFVSRRAQAVEEPAAPRLEPPARQGGLAEPAMVIVAAFDDADAGEPVASLSRAIRDEVVSGLSRFRDLRVITDPQRADSVRAEGITDRSRVYVLGATFRASAEGIRITVQLIRGSDRHVAWSDRLALPQANVVDTTERIIAQVVGAVLPSIHADLGDRAPMPSNLTYERYLVARNAAAQARSFDDARAAARELESIIEAEPGFVLPYLPLARLYNTDFGYTRALSSGPADRERAFLLAKTALAKDRRHVHGYTVMGWCYLWRHQWDAARSHFDQAIALNPFHAERVMEVGFGYLFLGEAETARQLLDRCLMLNPEPRDEFFTDLGLLELLRGDFNRAESYFELVANRTVWDTIYIAVNARLGGLPFAAKAETARSRLAAIWPEDVPMTEDAVLDWIGNHKPFRREEDRSRLLEGARELLLRPVPDRPMRAASQSVSQAPP